MALNIFNFNASLAVTPAKTPFITTLTLTTPFINLHPPPYSSFSFSSSAKLNSTPRASPPQKYSYPDPIPEFADAVSTCIYMFVLQSTSVFMYHNFYFCSILF